jgi:hypothetical protein
LILLNNDLLIFLSDIELKQGNNDNGTDDEGGQNDHHDMRRELHQQVASNTTGYRANDLCRVRL